MLCLNFARKAIKSKNTKTGLKSKHKLVLRLEVRKYLEASYSQNKQFKKITHSTPNCSVERECEIIS